MKEENEQHKYDDMIDLPHHVSTRHPQMSLLNRAAQFSPFAALTGHEDAVKETARLTDSFIEREEEQTELLNRRMQLLLSHMAGRGHRTPEIEVVYFRPDPVKSGGAYITYSGKVKKIDGYRREILFADGTVIPMEHIFSMEGALFAE